MLKTSLVIVLGLFLIAPSVSIARQTSQPGTGLGSSSGGAGRRGARRPARRAIQGQVISDGTRRLNHPVEVNLESLGVARNTVYTDGNGNFVFDQVAGGESFQLSVHAPGFKPARIDVTTGAFSMGFSVIILESVDSEKNFKDSLGAVDLSELLLDIPDEAVDLVDQAAEDSQKGDHEKAVEQLEDAIKVAPDYYQAQNALGAAYQSLGRIEDAIRHFLIAKDLSPNAAAPVVSLGTIYLRENDVHSRGGRLEEARASLDEAFSYLEDAVERDPLSEFAQYYLGAAHYRTGAFDKALDRLNRALGLNRRFHEVRIMLFNVYLAQREYDAALEQLTTYLELYPESPQREAIEGAKAAVEQQQSGR